MLYLFQVLIILGDKLIGAFWGPYLALLRVYSQLHTPMSQGITCDARSAAYRARENPTHCTITRAPYECFNLGSL